MIILDNGDRWIIDERETEGMDYEDVKRGVFLPGCTIKEFVHQLCDNGMGHLPRKWTTEFGGYWDANFDPWDEVVGYISTLTKEFPWAKIYLMPWGEVVVLYTAPDGSGYGCELDAEIYSSRHAFNEAALF